MVVPDILSNAGGVVVSYFEWVQNIQSVNWTEETVNEKLKDIMDSAFDAVWNIAESNNATLRTGAYLIAVKRCQESAGYLAIKYTLLAKQGACQAQAPRIIYSFPSSLARHMPDLSARSFTSLQIMVQYE